MWCYPGSGYLIIESRPFSCAREAGFPRLLARDTHTIRVFNPFMHTPKKIPSITELRFHIVSL